MEKFLSGSRYDAIKYAFTANENDQRSNIFIKSLFLLNERQELAPNDYIVEIMEAKHYEDSVKPAMMLPNHVHYQFIDFIIDAGLFHKELDDKRDTAASNVHMKKIYNNVYRKWHSLDQIVRQFYNKYFMLMFQEKPGVWREVNQFINLPENGQLYNINMKKWEFNTNRLDDVTVFEHDLPLYNKNIFSGFWITFTDTAPAGLAPLNKNDVSATLFKDLYHIMRNGVAPAHGPTQDYIDYLENSVYPLTLKRYVAPIRFNIQVDNIVRNRIFNIRNQKDESENVAHQKYHDLSSMWYKTVDGKVFRYENGVKVDYNVDDQSTKNLVTFANNCYTSLYTGTYDQCKDALHVCLDNDNQDGAKQCLEKLKTISFNDRMPQEVKKMHPLMALGILKKLGFMTEKVEQHNGTTYEQVEDLNRWAKRYAEQNSTDFYKFTVDNINLIKYLNLVVQFVNANPGILNPEYGEAKQNNNVQFKGSAYACQLGIKKRENPLDNQYYNNCFNRNFKLARIVLRGGAQPAFPFVQVKQRLVSPFGSNFVTPNRHIVAKSTAGNYDYLYNIVSTLLAELNHKGKTINSVDKAELEKLITAHKENEQTIGNIINTLEVYNNYIDMFSNYTTETLKLANIKKMTSIYQNRTGKRLNLDDLIFKTLRKFDALLEDDDKYKKISY